MLFEDDQSYLVSIYMDAQERKRDYDRYFVLATRYGHYSEEGCFFQFHRFHYHYFRYWLSMMHLNNRVS